jgi:hypothetical protein
MKKAAKFLMVLAVLVLLSPQKQFARENKGYIQLILHISLSTGLSPAGTEVTLSYGYYAVADSTGTVVFDSIPEGHYDISAFKIGYDAYHLNNVFIIEDKVYNIVLSEKKYPPACLSVDPLSLTGTWCEPMITALDQDFEDPVFPPPGWQLDPEENGWELINGDSAGSGGIPEWESYYILSAGNINGAPEAMITPPADLRENENYVMTLDSYYDGSYGGLAFLEYSLDGCETWEVLYQVMPDPSWTELEIDLGAFSGPSGPEQIWFAFVADDNGGWAPVWAIDNVKILVPDQPANYIDFWVFLNDTLVGETTNTSWDFAPLSYGQSFTASVAARYTSGLSARDYFTFTSEYLIPPDSLTGFAPDDAAILTWDPPVDSWYEIENGTREVGEVVLSFPAPTPIGLSWGICDDGQNLWVTDPNYSSTSIFQVTYNGEITGITITVSQGQSYIADLVSDGDFLYGCLVGGPNSIVKIDLATGETVGTITGDWTLASQRGLAADFYNEEFYIGGWNSDMIWRTDFSGNTISNFGFAGVSGLAWHPLGGPDGEGSLWVVTNDSSSFITEIDPNDEWATIQSFPMPGEQLFSGAGAEIKLTYPNSGCLWLTNMTDNTIYLVDLNEEGGGPVWGLPENLLGYNIYRNGTFLDYSPHTPPGEITPQFYIDEGISPGVYEYTVTAVYDISPYGFPGDSAESMEEGPVEVIGGCCFELDFMETWEQGNFEDNNWFVDGENWSVNGQSGTPSPAAEFTWDPIQENYSIALESYTFAAAGMTEGKIYMDFDLELDAVASTGEEKLIVGVKWDWESEVWDTVAEYSNAEGSFGWSAEHIDITSSSMGKVFRVRFLATGTNSLNLSGWLIDNIHIYRTCDAPSNLEYGFFSDGVELTWEPPILSGSEALKSVDDGSRELTGYNIYRSKDSEDYILLDFSDEPAYFDTGNDLIENSYYCYMVTAVWESETDQCESSFSNEACLMVGIYSPDPASIFSIYPNPASDFLVIVPEKTTSDREIFVTLYNSEGILILKKEFNNDGAEIRLDLDGLPSGVYWVTIESNSNPIKASKFIMF